MFQTNTSLPLDIKNNYKVLTESTPGSRSLLSLLDYSQLLHQPECLGWVPLNYIYYQAANMFLLLASITPNTLTLRAMMVVAFSFLTIWGWTVSCALDTTAWNCVLAVINLAWCAWIVWRRRTVKLTLEMERVYKQIFMNLKVSRTQFKVWLLSLTISLLVSVSVTTNCDEGDKESVAKPNDNKGEGIKSRISVSGVERKVSQPVLIP